MGTSRYEPLPFVVETLRGIKPLRILDVGVGFGKLGLLIREYLEVWEDRVTPEQWQIQLEGIEVFPDYHKDSFQHLVYDQLHYVDATTFDYSAGNYDFIICFDMIEHVSKEQGRALLQTFRNCAAQVLVSIPLGEGWLRDSFGQNPHEHHLAEWNQDELSALGYTCLNQFQIPDGRRVGIFGSGIAAIQQSSAETKNTEECDPTTSSRLLESHLQLRFDQLTENTDSIAIWGTGKHSEFLLDVLTPEQLERISYFVDDCAPERFYRWPVCRPEQAADAGVIILSSDTGVDELHRQAEKVLPQAQLASLYTDLSTEAVAGIKFNRISPTDKWHKWLKSNANERMDAVRAWDLFNEDRWLFHLARYRFACGYTDGKIAGDIACGTGYGSEILFKRGGAQQVTGVDLSEEAVAYARKHHSDGKIEFIAASGDQTGLDDGCLELLTSFETLEHVPNGQALLSEFNRLLKPGGTLIISTPNEWPLADNPHHCTEYNLDGFITVLEPWFEVEAMFNQNSGGGSPNNHGQPADIIPTTPENQSLAECFIAVCKKKI